MATKKKLTISLGELQVQASGIVGLDKQVTKDYTQAYWIGRNIDFAMRHLKRFDEQRMKIAKEFGSFDKGIGQWVLQRNSPLFDKASEAIEKLSKQEVELSYVPLSLKELQTAGYEISSEMIRNMRRILTVDLTDNIVAEDDPDDAETDDPDEKGDVMAEQTVDNGNHEQM